MPLIFVSIPNSPYLHTDEKINSTTVSLKKLFLLDGHALVYRAHYAFISRPLYNSKGLNTSAITGFVRTLWDLIIRQKPSHIAVSFDISGDTFRNEIYPEYKANRDAQPEDITKALPYIEAIVKAFNIPIVTLENFEADDLIGTIAKQAALQDFNVFMVTPDKDFAQLVDKNIFIYKPGKRGGEPEILGVPEILSQWQINRVEQVIDILAMQGDPVDNIPGIPGVGPKTAVKLINQYGSLENIIAHTDELKGALKERFIKFADQARLSKVLATIDVNAPVQFNSDTYLIENMDKAELSKLFKELEFRALAKSILGEAQSGEQGQLFDPKSMPQNPSSPFLDAHDIAEKTLHDVEHRYILCDHDDKINQLISKLHNAKHFCFDVETTGLNALQTDLVGLSFALKPSVAYYVPIDNDKTKALVQLNRFKAIFENPDIAKIAQNIKFDAKVLLQYDIRVQGAFYDTMIMHHLLEPELRHNMDYLAETYLKYKPISITTLIGKKGKKQKSMRDVPPETLLDYAAEDADITLQLFEQFQIKLKEAALDTLYKDIEAPLIKVLIDMEWEGVHINADFLKHYSRELAEKMLELQDKIYQKAGTSFNISSPKQVGQVLFEQLKIPYRWRKTSSGQYATGEEKLSELAPKYEIVADILHFRMMAKLKSTYLDALPNMIHPDTGRIHTSFNQALASTGRLSSNKPNLQNIPIKTPEGKKIREAFVPRNDDYILLAADYSQIELRLIAEISQEKSMLEAFQKELDIHRATAAKVYGVDYDQVTMAQRRNAKTVNFSIIYGAGALNLARQLGIGKSEAKKLIEAYFKQYSGLKTYMEHTVDFARKHGFVKTLIGRKRKLRDINSRNNMARSAAERIAINSPIQGTAADLIKIAMVDIHRYLRKKNLKTKMILQVHDELLFDVYKGELDHIAPIIEQKMKNALPNLSVPIVVSMDTGTNWAVAH